MLEEEKVQCTRCRNKHLQGERVSVQSNWLAGVRDLVCPRCKCRNYYRLNADGTRGIANHHILPPRAAWSNS